MAEDDDWEALIRNQEAEEEGGWGAEKEPLSHSTLWGMQLEREEQSHQEACDKYSKVTVISIQKEKGT